MTSFKKIGLFLGLRKGPYMYEPNLFFPQLLWFKFIEGEKNDANRKVFVFKLILDWCFFDWNCRKRLQTSGCFTQFLGENIFGPTPRQEWKKTPIQTNGGECSTGSAEKWPKISTVWPPHTKDGETGSVRKEIFCYRQTGSVRKVHQPKAMLTCTLYNLYKATSGSLIFFLWTSVIRYSTNPLLFPLLHPLFYFHLVRSSYLNS